MMRFIFVVVLLFVNVKGCKNDEDCNLNGVCDAGQCKCVPQWVGTTCDTLNLLPAQPQASYNDPTVSTWGANIVHDETTNTYHIWFAEMVLHCGLTSWLRNSQIVHAVAPSPNGPWTRKEVAIEVWSHNPIVVKAPDGTLLMFHIGQGTTTGVDAPYPCTPPNGTSPCGLIFPCNETTTSSPQLPVFDSQFPISVSTSFDGPWKTYLAPYSGPSITPNNPAPYISSNGTTYVVFSSSDGMTMIRAQTWRGPYSLMSRNACGNGEDPFLYVDKNENFHCLFHNSPFSNPSIAIGHAFSPDKGMTWKITPNAACGSTIEYEGGKKVVYGKRERPHLFFNKSGNPTHIVTGVCVNPDYMKCDRNHYPGHYDKSFTLIQRIHT